MASLKQLQKKVPGAETVAGRVIAYHNGKHYDLGEYVGDDAVVLSKDGERLMNPEKFEPKQPKLAGKPPPIPKGLLGLEDLDV